MMEMMMPQMGMTKKTMPGMMKKVIWLPGCCELAELDRNKNCNSPCTAVTCPNTGCTAAGVTDTDGTRLALGDGEAGIGLALEAGEAREKGLAEPHVDRNRNCNGCPK